jgi:hypothetical protein
VPDSDVITAADIARLAGVTRATVSNWRRRHADFPAPAGGTAASPAYARDEVEDWLAGRGALAELPPDKRLWRLLLAQSGRGGDLASTVTWAADYLASAGQRDSATTAAYARWPELADALAGAARAQGWRNALDALVGRFADARGGGALATPAPVAELMADLAHIGEGDVVLDPAAGTGNLLFSARKHGAARLLGQDLDATLADLKARRYTAEPSSAETVLATGDSLRDDRFADVLADVVLCHPPFGVADWGYDEMADDARWEYGTPPRSEGELAWVQDALAHLRTGGRALLLMPPAVASRPSGRRIRAELVRRGVLRGVVSLPPGSAEPRHVPLHIWALNRPGGQGTADPHLLLMDAASLTGSWASVAEKIVRTWTAFREQGAAAGEEPALWRVVPAVDLLDDAVDVTPARNVGAIAQISSPAQTRAEISKTHEQLRRTLLSFGSEVPGEDWTVNTQAARWRKASIADLGRWESVTFHRASLAAPGDQDVISAGERPPGRAVLLAADVQSGEPPSGLVPDGPIKPGWVVVQQLDVILPASALGRVAARVAGQEDQGAILGRGLHLIRPDPARIDSWFLSGFLTSTENILQASAGSTGSRIDVRRLTIPVLPLADQQRYATALRELHALETASRELASLTSRYSRLLNDQLVAGRLEPGTETAEVEQNS